MGYKNKIQLKLLETKRDFIIGFATILLLISFLFYFKACDKQQKEVSVKTDNIIFFRIDGAVEFLDSLKSPSALISVEIADDEYEIATGLMYRKAMADSLGMLFIFPTSEQRSFWMKNTYIPLDIIFVNEKFEIVAIQKYTQPFNEGPITSEWETKYVIEVNAGYCDVWKIKEGQMIQFSLIQ